MGKPICSVAGCERPSWARGLCSSCYQRKRSSGELQVLRPHGKSVEQRIRENIAIDAESGCWLWQLGTDGDGYGHMKVAGKTVHSYRASYEAFVGPIPDGLQIDHVCHTRDTSCPAGKCKHRLCVNPEHLEPVTLRENVERSRTDPRANFADYWDRRRATTHCPHGHPWDEENTRWQPLPAGGQQRVCRACTREAMRRHRARKKLAAK